MIQKNARQNVEDTLSTLQKSIDSLRQAASTVENTDTKKRIEREIQTVSTTLTECQNIANTLRQQ
jgi:chaperonin cofactor prefoldin